MSGNGEFIGFTQVILFTIIVFRYCSFLSKDNLLWLHFCHQDVEYCPQCFDNDICETNWDLRLMSTYGSDFNSIIGVRQVQRASWVSFDGRNENIILKHLTDNIKTNMKSALCNQVRTHFTTSFEKVTDCSDIWQHSLQSNDLVNILSSMQKMSSEIGGFLICSPITNEFTNTFNQFTNNVTFWMQLWMNSELVVLQAIHHSNHTILKNAIPRIVDWRGFVILEEDVGSTTLMDFYDDPLMQRIHLAKQLMEIAISFAYGLNGFRMYLTDATPDNIVVDRSTLQIKFVDLDSLIIVNSHLIKSMW